MSLPARKTRIVATLGPSCSERAVLERMIRAGMNVARINFAHGTPADRERAVGNLREAERVLGARIAVFGDLPGPKIRVGEIEGGAVELARGAPFVLRSEPTVGDSSGASVGFDGLESVVKPGDVVFLNDGFLELEVEEVVGREVRCRVEIGGELRSNKGVNLPGADLGIRAFTQDDERLLAEAARLELDGVSQSFVQDRGDVEAVRDAAAAIGYEPMVIAKIERARALDHVDGILAASDAIMVARGDLGVETPIERMALVQKQLIAAANRAAVPVITATHMLESMTEHARPTRAEATDVANAILDGSDCLMLSGETAVGAHPVDVVRTVARIAEEVERAGVRSRIADRAPSKRWAPEDDRVERLSTAAFEFIEGLQPRVVVAGTLSGLTARSITRFRIDPWIVAVTKDERVCRRLVFSYGVHPVRHAELPRDFVAFSRARLRELGVEQGIALLLLPDDVAGETGLQQLQILEL